MKHVATLENPVLHLAFSLEGLRDCLERKAADELVVVMVPVKARPLLPETGIFYLVTTKSSVYSKGGEDEVFMDDLVMLTERHSRILSW